MLPNRIKELMEERAEQKDRPAILLIGSYCEHDPQDYPAHAQTPPAENWAEQARQATSSFVRKMSASAQHFLRLHGIEKELEALKSRVDRLEASAAAVTSLPPKRVLSPKIRWLRENRGSIMSTYADKWIAVTDDGVLDSDTSLGKLFERVQAGAHAQAVNYVKVSKPVSAE